MAVALVEGVVSCMSFGAHVAKFEIEYSNNGIDVTCELYSCNIITKQFEVSDEESNKRRICVAHRSLLPKECQVTIVDCRSLKMAETSLAFPFLLLKKCVIGNRKGTTFIVIGFLPTAMGLTLSQIGTPLSLPNNADWGPSLANGPAVCWAMAGRLYLHLFNHASADFLCHKFFICDSSILYRVVDVSLNFVWDVQPTVLRAFLAMVIYSEVIAFTLQYIFSTVEGTIQNQEKFEAYENSPFHSCLKECIVARLVEGNQSPTHLLITTARSQIMLFCDIKQPVLCSVCNIPFFNVNNVIIDKRCSKGYCILTSCDGNSCTLDLQSFKVSISNKSPFFVFTGDFLHVGDPHLLFLSCKAEESGSSFAQRYFEITDMEYNLLMTGNAEEVIVDPSLLTTAKALQSRLMAGKTAVSNSKSELCQLTTTISDIAFSLQSLAMDEEQSYDKHRPYVFGLLNGKQLPITHEKHKIHLIEAHYCKPLDAGMPWRRIVEDMWIIGIQIRNYSKKKLSNFHLILTTPFHQLEQKSKMFLIGESYYPFLPTASSQVDMLSTNENNGQGGMLSTSSKDFATVLLPGQSAILTTVLSSDLLGHKSKINCNVVVTFKREDTSKKSVSAVTCSPFIGEMKDFLMEAHQITFPSEDVMKALCDLAAVDAITDSKKLTFLSKSTNLYDISKILQEKLQFTFHAKLQILYWNNPGTTCLKYIWIEIQEIENSFKCHCNIHTRSRGQFFKFMHYLYQYLPEDILILPLNEDYEASFSSHLMREANLVTNFFGTFADQHTEASEPTNFATIAEARQSFLQRKKNFDEPPNPYASIDINEYKEFRKQLFQYEQASDKAFISILNKKSK